MNSPITITGSVYFLSVILMPATVCIAQDDHSPTNSTGQLSVAPLDHVEYPLSRPVWVSKVNDPSSGPNRFAVVTRPHDTQDQCAEEIKWLTRAAVASYANDLVGADSSDDFFSLSDEEIEATLITRCYEGTVIAGGTVKQERAVQLRFDETLKTKIEDQWRDRQVGKRLRVFGFVAALGSFVLIGSSGLLGILSRKRK